MKRFKLIRPERYGRRFPIRAADSDRVFILCGDDELETDADLSGWVGVLIEECSCPPEKPKKLEPLMQQEPPEEEIFIKEHDAPSLDEIEEKKKNAILSLSVRRLKKVISRTDDVDMLIRLRNEEVQSENRISALSILDKRIAEL